MCSYFTKLNLNILIIDNKRHCRCHYRQQRARFLNIQMRMGDQAVPRGFRRTHDSKTISKINFIFSIGTTYVFLTHENPLCVRVCVRARASASVCCHGCRNMETSKAQ